MKLESIGGYTDCTTIVLPTGLPSMVTLLSPSGNIRTSVLMYLASNFLAKLFARDCDAGPPMTVKFVNTSIA